MNEETEPTPFDWGSFSLWMPETTSEPRSVRFHSPPAFFLFLSELNTMLLCAWFGLILQTCEGGRPRNIVLPS